MIITSYVDGGFKIQTSGITLLTEPPQGKIPARLKADIFLNTTPNNIELDSPVSIKGPGEYEIKGVEIRGFPSYIYSITAEEINLGYFGQAPVIHPEFDPMITDKLKDLDIMFAEAGVASAKAIRQFHPKTVIIIGNPSELEKEFGVKAEKTDKLTVKKKDFAAQELKLISFQ